MLEHYSTDKFAGSRALSGKGIEFHSRGRSVRGRSGNQAVASRGPLVCPGRRRPIPLNPG